jgi:hypothetical protein
MHLLYPATGGKFPALQTSESVIDNKERGSLPGLIHDNYNSERPVRTARSRSRGDIDSFREGFVYLSIARSW